MQNKQPNNERPLYDWVNERLSEGLIGCSKHDVLSFIPIFGSKEAYKTMASDLKKTGNRLAETVSEVEAIDAVRGESGSFEKMINKIRAGHRRRLEKKAADKEISEGERAFVNERLESWQPPEMLEEKKTKGELEKGLSQFESKLEEINKFFETREETSLLDKNDAVTLAPMLASLLVFSTAINETTSYMKRWEKEAITKSIPVNSVKEIDNSKLAYLVVGEKKILDFSALRESRRKHNSKQTIVLSKTVSPAFQEEMNFILESNLTPEKMVEALRKLADKETGTAEMNTKVSLNESLWDGHVSPLKNKGRTRGGSKTESET